jgi:hypothetical protein
MSPPNRSGPPIKSHSSLQSDLPLFLYLRGLSAPPKYGLNLRHAPRAPSHFSHRWEACEVEGSKDDFANLKKYDPAAGHCPHKSTSEAGRRYSFISPRKTDATLRIPLFADCCPRCGGSRRRLLRTLSLAGPSRCRSPGKEYYHQWSPDLRVLAEGKIRPNRCSTVAHG